MPPDGIKTRANILKSAQNEFLRYGFANASLRKIASGAAVTTGALYRHFKSKEALFEALMAPCIKEFMEIYEKSNEGFANDFAQTEIESLWPASRNDLIELTEYIYDHLEVFQILLLSSEQAAYQEFTHGLINREVEMMMNYLRSVKDNGNRIHDMTSQEMHMFVNAQFSVFFEMVLHNLSKEEALQYTDSIFQFFAAGWRQLLIGVQ